MVSTTPCFLGADPASSPLLGGAVHRPLARTEDLARDLVRSLPAELAARAVILPKAPADLVTANRSVVAEGDRASPGPGVHRSSEGPPGRRPRRRAAGAAARPARHLLRAGPTEPGRPHYYRLQGPRLLIEWDSTRRGANHAHSVWRDPSADFGLDVLAAHRTWQH